VTALRQREGRSVEELEVAHDRVERRAQLVRQGGQHLRSLGDLRVALQALGFAQARAQLYLAGLCARRVDARPLTLEVRALGHDRVEGAPHPRDTERQRERRHPEPDHCLHVQQMAARNEEPVGEVERTGGASDGEHDARIDGETREEENQEEMTDDRDIAVGDLVEEHREAGQADGHRVAREASRACAARHRVRHGHERGPDDDGREEPRAAGALEAPAARGQHDEDRERPLEEDQALEPRAGSLEHDVRAERADGRERRDGDRRIRRDGHGAPVEPICATGSAAGPTDSPVNQSAAIPIEMTASHAPRHASIRGSSRAPCAWSSDSVPSECGPM
jgi:hypothetical protein